MRPEHSNRPTQRAKTRATTRSTTVPNDSDTSNGSASNDEQRYRQRLARVAHDLLHDARLLDSVGHTIAALGYAGDVRPAVLAYVAMLSCLLTRPLNLAYVGQSAIGKNRAPDGARELVPEEAVVIFRGASEKALIYSAEDYKHRTILFYESDSIPEDGPAASAIRSLMSENVMEYEVTERDPKTNQWVTRKIKKDGPTGLITTSIKSLRTQMHTRTLEISLSDDREQTRAIMHAHADDVNPNPGRAKVKISPFIAFYDWLSVCGERRVVVPARGR